MIQTVYLIQWPGMDRVCVQTKFPEHLEKPWKGRVFRVDVELPDGDDSIFSEDMAELDEDGRVKF